LPASSKRHPLAAQALTCLEGLAARESQLLLTGGDGAFKRPQALRVGLLGVEFVLLARLEDPGERHDEVLLQDRVAHPEGKKHVETRDVR
jgi:hypothetical protein